MIGFVWLVASAMAGKSVIVGTVVDRNGDPVPRAVVAVDVTTKARQTLGVALMTDRSGKYRIEYLRVDGEERTMKLPKKSAYAIEVFKPGYHQRQADVYLRSGKLVVDPITLVEETIAVQDLPENLDPGTQSESAPSTGATFEWQ